MTTRRMQKNLTVMFTDISGFTRHTETITRDELMSRLDTHNQLLMPIIAHFEGKIVKTIGDAFLITFESPTNAVQCGLFMQHTLRQHNQGKPEPQQIHIKISINSGEVTVTENDVFGDPVNVSAKIEKATNPDEIYFTESVFLAMNKAEVPTSFVKTFRPKGADSQEIKLYKVAMDEGDERYQRVVNATHIDADKVKTRVMELSNAAEKEFSRYQDTLDALVESQGASSRNTVIAVVIAAVILAVAIVVGFAIFGGKGEDPDQLLTRDVRSYLSNGKPQDARDLIRSHEQAHGASATTAELLKDIENYELNDATSRAEALLDSGEPEKAAIAVKEALRGNSPGEAQQRVLDRAQAFADARAALRAGDTAKAFSLSEAAAGTAGFSEPLKKLREQAQAIDDARRIIADEARLKDQSAGVIERLTIAFGERSDIPVVNELLIDALKSRLFWEARNKPWDGTKKLLETLKQRLIGIADWRAVEREMYLGGFWSYVGRNDRQDEWWSWHNQKWQEMRNYLDSEATGDPDFSFRLGSNIYDINRRKNIVITVEQYYIGRALDEKPELAKQHKTRLIEMCRTWLLYDNLDDDPVRNIVRRHLYDDMKPYLVEGLTAMSPYGEKTDPNFERRQNSFALLADRGDLVIEDPFAYFRDNFPIFMENAWAKKNNDGTAATTALTREQVRALFRMKMSAVEYGEFKTLLERTVQDIDARTGRWAAYTYTRQTAEAMLEDLKAAQPEHAATGG